MLYFEVCPKLSFSYFSRRVPSPIRILWILFVVLLRFAPLGLQRVLIPPEIRAFLASTYLALGYEEEARKLLLLAIECQKSRLYALKLLTSVLSKENGLSRIRSLFLELPQVTEREVDEALDDFAFWNLNHQSFEIYLVGRAKQMSEKLVFPHDSRTLHGFETNMGHLACMYLYVNYFGRSDRMRRVVIGSSKVANSFYLELIKRHSSLIITEEKLVGPENDRIDSLLLQLGADRKKFRIGPDAAFFGPHDFSDWRILNHEKLTLTESEIIQGRLLAEDWLPKDRWIVGLHVRGPKSGVKRDGQARDASVFDYRELCELIWDLGGIAVRMGDSRFPPFQHKGIVCDYANSDFRSDFMDCWLWYSMRNWVGNSHGASIPPLTFGKRRLMTNQWYWNLVGGEEDLVVPKLLTRNNKVLSIEETFASKLSRAMHWEWFQGLSMDLLDNPSDVLVASYLELLDESSGSAASLNIGKEFMKHQGLSIQTPAMKVSTSFAEWYESNLS